VKDTMTETPPPSEQPQQTPPGYTHYGYPQYTPEPHATSKATLALILGIVGLTICPGAASIPAWIIGHEAVKEIDASNGQLGGRSMAFAGKVTGIIGTALAGLGLLVVGAIFLISAVFVSSVDDCQGSSTESSFSFHC
jgi:hypothetical protein